MDTDRLLRNCRKVFAGADGFQGRPSCSAIIHKNKQLSKTDISIYLIRYVFDTKTICFQYVGNLLMRVMSVEVEAVKDLRNLYKKYLRLIGKLNLIINFDFLRFCDILIFLFHPKIMISLLVFFYSFQSKYFCKSITSHSIVKTFY